MKLFFFALFIMWGSLPGKAAVPPERIITLSGALTETVDALGLGKNIVGTDVTSTYPASLSRVPKVSRNRSVSAEGLMAFRPGLVLAPEGDVPKEIQYQLKEAGIRFVSIRQEYSVTGALNFIRKVAAACGVQAKGEALAKQTFVRVQAALSKVKSNPVTKDRVLFIYARGSGTMLVAGKGSSLDAIIRLAGGRNAIQEFADFKPYTTESLVKANPDAILMFDFGLSSLGGRQSVLAMPGVSLTNAGKSSRVIDMDGSLLTSFSTRLPDAITGLNERLTASR